MIRGQSISREIPYILMVLVGLALVVLVINRVILESPAFQHGSSQVAQPAIALNRSWEADANRWNAMVKHYASLNATLLLNRLWQADASRWNAAVKHYAGLNAASLLNRSWQADASRWNAISSYFVNLSAKEK
jgi:hypothetical protein